MRRAAKVDANHAPLLRLMRQIGAYVYDTSRVGGGFPDALVFWRGRAIPVEIKDGSKPPSARKLTEAQEALHARWASAGWPVVVVETEADVFRLLGVMAA